MKDIIKKAEIPYTSDIVGAATDIKDNSTKRTGNVICGSIFLALGVITALLVLSTISLLFTTPFGIATFGLLLLLATLGLLLLFMIAAVVGSFSSTSDWFLVLYENRLLYKYILEEEDGSVTYEQIEVPIEDINRCYILCEYRKDITVRGVNTSAHYMSIHIQYNEDDEQKYISIYRLDGYQDISAIINYLEKEKSIPVYYATAQQELGEEINDLESLENADLITFSGNLKDYNLGKLLN